MKDIGFCLYILFVMLEVELKCQKAKNEFKMVNQFGSHFFKSLIKFNEGSLVSNRMTADLLLGEFSS